MGAMDVDVLFCGMPVREFAAAQRWYERFFGRAADVVAHDTEVMWQVAEGAWLYVVADDAHAGHALAAMAVADLDATISTLAGRGITVGRIEPQGDAGRKAIARDPDGNQLALIDVTTGQ